MKLLVYPVDLHLTYGHELWVATERMRMQIQVVEMSVADFHYLGGTAAWNLTRMPPGQGIPGMFYQEEAPG